MITQPSKLFPLNSDTNSEGVRLPAQHCFGTTQWQHAAQTIETSTITNNVLIILSFLPAAQTEPLNRIMSPSSP
jgi:hypothetical protein